MSSWYIDRSRNIKSCFESSLMDKMKEWVQNKNEISTQPISPAKLIKKLNIDKSFKNPNALLTYLRDIGLIDYQTNLPSQFFRTCVYSQLSNEQIILLILLKKNSEKNDKSTVKPFVVICKAMSLLVDICKDYYLTWDDCVSFLQKIDNYDDITEQYILEMINARNINDKTQDSSIMDIWFNGLTATGLFFEGDKKRIYLNKKYLKFIKFVAKYGQEMICSQNRDEGLYQMGMDCFGLSEMIYNHSLAAIDSFENLNVLFDFFRNVKTKNNIQSLDGCNKIYYGIPGCGKSYKIKKELEEKHVPQENIFRTTFYLDYSNSDFVGQILPKVEGEDVKYEYNPGPFTKALTRAFNTNDMVYLIIEEINRGNAAAIFGDLFQLLDRKKEDDSYGPSGESEYPITNEFIESYLKKNVSGGYHKELIYIPNNLTILATMNTSDQNVFPLDTAFKRRWDMERVKGDINACEFKDYYIPYTSIKWCEFQEQVNKQITISASNGLITEDKQLGPWFASKDMFVKEKNQGDKKKLEKFVYNVMDYIYNDVCKFEKEGWFIGNVSFADICNSILEHPDKENVSENLCLAFLKKYTDNKESNDDQS